MFRNRITLGNYLLFAAGLLCMSSIGHAQSTLHINVNATGGLQQIVLPGQLLPEPFVARVTDDNGKPLAGVSVSFEVNSCAEFSAGPPGGPTCPPGTLYGSFSSAADATVVTDQNGTAVAPVFTAGSTSGSYSVFVAYFPWDQVINGQTLTDMPFTSNNLFQIIQADPSAATTPALSPWSIALMTVLLALVANAGLRSRGSAKRAN
jgi:hypothetical protein